MPCEGYSPVNDVNLNYYYFWNFIAHSSRRQLDSCTSLSYAKRKEWLKLHAIPLDIELN